MRVTVVSRRKRIKVFQVLPSGEGPSSSGFSTPGLPPLQPATKSIFAQSTLGGKATDEFTPSTNGSEMENTQRPERSEFRHQGSMTNPAPFHNTQEKEGVNPGSPETEEEKSYSFMPYEEFMSLKTIDLEKGAILADRCESHIFHVALFLL